MIIIMLFYAIDHLQTETSRKRTLLLGPCQCAMYEVRVRVTFLLFHYNVVGVSINFSHQPDNFISYIYSMIYCFFAWNS